MMSMFAYAIIRSSISISGPCALPTGCVAVVCHHTDPETERGGLTTKTISPWYQMGRYYKE